MKPQLALGLALAMMAAGALAEEKAKPRSGGSSSAVGSRHHSGGSKATASRSSGSSHTGSATLSDAQRRHPRPGYGSGARGRYYGRGYYPYSGYYGYRYYRPYYAWGLWPYYDFYGGWGYPYGYYGGYGGYGGYYGYYGAPYYNHRDGGSVRVLVDPEQTRVYVDGYYAGVADEFDGLFQRLHVSPGRHEIVLRLDGYRSHRMKVYVPYEGTLKIHHDMVKGEGESAEDLVGPGLPEDRDEWARRDRDYRDRDYRDRYDRDRDADDPDDDAWRERGARAPGRESAELRLAVRPDDASVYVDGEFRGSGRQARQLRLPPGRHRVEVVRPGYRTWDQEVEVGPDGAEVTVELARP